MLLLYILEGCPYCKKVIKHMEENHIEFRPMDVSNPVNHDELLILGKDDQVPFLVDTGKNVKLYESDDIIEYVDTL